MRRVIWTDQAVANLEAIVTYVSVFNPAAASRLAQQLVAVADGLAEFSERGRIAGPSHREMTIARPYILRYRVERDVIYIVRIRHSARQDED